MIRRFKITETQRGLHFREGDFQGILGPGVHYLFDPLHRVKVDIVSIRDPILAHRDAEVIAKSGALKGMAEVVELKDYERAILWIDGRYRGILAPGRHVVWTLFNKIDVETIDIRGVRFEHENLVLILKQPSAQEQLALISVGSHEKGMLFVNGQLKETLGAGVYAYWKQAGNYVFDAVDLRESTLDVAGQELMTADRVTLRLNALVTYRVTDPVLAATTVDDAAQTLYREAQLALRAAVGTRDLDTLLADKNTLTEQILDQLRLRATPLGVEALGFGIKDIILPGDMKEMLNKVTEARKAAEASLITRREETAEIRHLANTAKVYENNPTLMRLRELEVLEKVARTGNMTVFAGDKGLADRVVKLI